MIRALRLKFIAASLFSLAVVLLVILGGVNLMSYRTLGNAPGRAAGPERAGSVPRDAL